MSSVLSFLLTSLLCETSKDVDNFLDILFSVQGADRNPQHWFRYDPEVVVYVGSGTYDQDALLPELAHDFLNTLGGVHVFYFHKEDRTLLARRDFEVLNFGQSAVHLLDVFL